TSAPATNPVLLWTIRLIGFIATVAVTLYVTEIARQALASVISE
ncbi:MAG: TVP38/TMEM64 family protein, partial [Microcystis aeruginosa]